MVGPRASSAPNLTPQELARVQMAIDSGTIWATIDGGRFAMSLITAGKCQCAPGVLNMWLREDGLYEPIYSREVLNARLDQLTRDAPVTLKKIAASKRELEFLERYRGELLRLVEEKIASTPWLPWRRRKHKLVYLEKLNALRARAGLPPLDALPW